MACVQQVRTSQDQLLPSQVLSEEQSLVLIKKLLAIAVSGITYLRGLFPEEAYGSKHVENQEVMILKEHRSCPGACGVVQWLQGCFEAIEKKYLRTAILSIYTDLETPQKVTEYYQFSIQYTAKGAQMDLESNNNMSTISLGTTKKASILLVRKLYILMQNLGPLPDKVYLNMTLAYYDNVTPQDYQPPGFKESDSDTLLFEKEPVKLAIGKVLTPFNSLMFDMVTERQRMEQVEESVHVTEKWVVNINEESELSQTHMIEDAEGPDYENTDLDITAMQMSCHEENVNCEEATKMDTEVKKISDMEVGVKRTRSGRIIRSSAVIDKTVDSKKPRAMKDKMVSQYDIPSSQETLSSRSEPQKRRKVSKPKEHN